MPRTPAPLPISWPLLPVPDVHGRLHFPGLEESVRQMIRVILSTRPGEQLMRPLFGAGLQDFLYEPNDLATRRRIHDRVLESLQQWEPRIAIDRVEVAEVEGQPGKVRVELAYRIRRTGRTAQLAVTLSPET